ncbi:hypothetical protein [Pseudidiomarina sediminum]|uniref:hypothetical protein n=1 Tax=Pseudidiomarina sediminum TaxID=431675 RepID=UPI001C94DBDB|nr:hypothetical protein [Pseudidiomarina sediminum]MBY6064686.1 hypothetical protein [Pseudidiomarina sediminum]
MNTAQEQKLTELLSYHAQVPERDFVAEVMVKVQRKRNMRRWLFTLAILGAMVCAALLIHISAPTSWQALWQALTQTPGWFAAILSIGLVSGALIRDSS